MKKKAVREEKEAKQQEIVQKEAKTLKLTEFVTTNDLAIMLNIKAADIILKCMQLGLMVTINQRLDKDTILLIADDYNYEVEFVEDTALDDLAEIVDDESTLENRPPIVTIMGHVDHGKTSLLDHIRNANVVAGEAGGITQHIGAYRVILKNGKSITFLDTPGHEAFTAMRARGAQVTDIVVLVVAADDSVMPQTIEAISHARAANVPIVVAINKVDKPAANIDKIKQQLSEQGILVEDWGGKNQSAEISAKKGTNVDVLLDKILLEAEMLELKANPNRNAQGTVIEAKMTKGWGNVATVVIQKGTLNIGDSFIAGAHYGKIRALLDERGKKVQDVLPSQPVVVIGFDTLPAAGDIFTVVNSEIEAREIATHRSQLRREQEMRKVRYTTLDDISAQISIGGTKELNLIIKGDVAGSVEALSDSLLKLSTEEVKVNILLKGAGTITESDVMLASASGAVIVGFNTSSTPQAVKLAENDSIEIRNYSIIYDAINEIHLALEGMLKPDIKEEVAAVVEVRQIFKISRLGQIAGCYVVSGKVTRNDKIRILRDGFPIFTGILTSLKRNKDDVKEVDTAYECGIQIANFNSFEVGDIIEALKYVEIKRTLTL
jgi:translation initiation factor IF-2